MARDNWRFSPQTFRGTGKAGELAVAANLIMRGVNPLFPAIDDGVDLYTTSGCRIQVKASRLHTTTAIINKHHEEIYRFCFPKVRYRSLLTYKQKADLEKKVLREFHEYCDIVVLWGVEQNRFWIVPAKLLSGSHGVALGSDNARLFEKDIPEMKAMIAAGKSQREVGEYFGITASAVCIRLQRAGKKIYLRSPTAAIRACENAWHHITEFGAAQQDAVPSLEVQQE